MLYLSVGSHTFTGWGAVCSDDRKVAQKCRRRSKYKLEELRGLTETARRGRALGDVILGSESGDHQALSGSFGVYWPVLERLFEIAGVALLAEELKQLKTWVSYEVFGSCSFWLLVTGPLTAVTSVTGLPRRLPKNRAAAPMRGTKEAFPHLIGVMAGLEGGR